MAFHSSLTVEQTTDLERIQKSRLKVILSENYVDYEAALEMTGHATLYARRKKRVSDFLLKMYQTPSEQETIPTEHTRQKQGHICSQFCKGTYQKSTIPYCQNKLNEHFALNK